MNSKSTSVSKPTSLHTRGFFYKLSWTAELSVFIAFYLCIYTIISFIFFEYFTGAEFYRILSIALITAFFSNMISKVLIGYLRDF